MGNIVEVRDDAHEDVFFDDPQAFAHTGVNGSSAATWTRMCRYAPGVLFLSSIGEPPYGNDPTD